MSPIISVIIPVYNVEDYLSKCIDSILCQSFKDYEIILVDDGSTDSSFSICKKYERRDHRIVVFHKTNGGQSSARNLGLEMAKGRYIVFVDSDDWIMPGMFEEMLGLALKTNADIVVCNFYPYMNHKIVALSPATGTISEFTQKVQYYDHLLYRKPVLRFELWNKLIKKEIIGETRFKEKQIFEELHFDRNIFTKAKKVIHIDTPFYVYRQSRLGNTNSSFDERRLVKFPELQLYIDELIQLGEDNIAAQYCKYAADSALYLYSIALSNCADNQILKIIVENYHKYYNGFTNHTLKHRLFRLSPLYYSRLIGLLVVIKKFIIK